MNNTSYRLFLLRTLVALVYFIGACGACNSAYDKSASAAKEAMLREDLRVMRGMIKQYANDKGALPQSLEDLVETGYIRSIQEDPMTGKRDWKVTIGEEPKLAKGPKGVVDVHSSSSAKSSEGKPYSEW
jgi:general secretion pathway protein G